MHRDHHVRPFWWVFAQSFWTYRAEWHSCWWRFISVFSAPATDVVNNEPLTGSWFRPLARRARISRWCAAELPVTHTLFIFRLAADAADAGFDSHRRRYAESRPLTRLGASRSLVWSRAPAYDSVVTCCRLSSTARYDAMQSTTQLRRLCCYCCCCVTFSHPVPVVHSVEYAALRNAVSARCICWLPHGTYAWRRRLNCTLLVTTFEQHTISQ